MRSLNVFSNRKMRFKFCWKEYGTTNDFWPHPNELRGMVDRRWLRQHMLDESGDRRFCTVGTATPGVHRLAQPDAHVLFQPGMRGMTASDRAGIGPLARVVPVGSATKGAWLGEPFVWRTATC
jgi:hypothetical protein